MPPNDTSARDVEDILDVLMDQIGAAADDADSLGSFAVAYRIAILQSKARHLRVHGRFDAIEEAVMEAAAFGFPADRPTAREAAAAAERISCLHRSTTATDS